MEPTTEELLRRDLEDLCRRSMADRSLNRNPNETDQRIDDVEMRWTEALEKERGQRRDQAQNGAVYTVEQQELAASERDRLSQDQAMATTSREIAEAWQSQPRTELNPAFDHQRREAAAQLVKPLHKQIDERFDRLRDGLEKSVDAIREGRSPDLRFLQLEDRARNDVQDLEQAMQAIRDRNRDQEERER